jgi:hypothetical protein
MTGRVVMAGAGTTARLLTETARGPVARTNLTLSRRSVDAVGRPRHLSPLATAPEPSIETLVREVAR